MSSMEEDLRRIKNAAGHLNKLAEEANEMIRAVWKALEVTNAGLLYETPNLSKDPDEVEWLGWMRHDGKFTLMHQSSDTGSQWRRLIDAPREARIRVAQFLPAFVDAYAKHMSSYMALREADMARARESTEELGEALKRLSSNG